MMSTDDPIQLGIVGMGYVGLPLAIEFGRLLPTIGFDIRAERIRELQSGIDLTREVPAEELVAARHLRFSDDPRDLAECNVCIVTVPTPIDRARRPDLEPLLHACRLLGRQLRRGNLVIFESTVYPGATEEICVPVLERESGLRYNVDFFCGYSPERINPGDKLHRLPDIVKVTAGSTPEVAERVDALYRRIIRAGTHKVSSIRVAEAAKVIENTQRDLNIALMNELAMLFSRLGIDTLEVLEAAGTKWNFLPFRPGLVGGHCIGVDPYYLTHKAQEVGYHPEVILAGRRINDGMGAHVAHRVIKRMSQKGLHLVDARVLVLGLTFKENCPDLRNTRVIDVIHELQSYGMRIEVHDPWAIAAEAKLEHGIDLLPQLPATADFDAVVLAVPHREYLALAPGVIRSLLRERGVLFDVKAVLPPGIADDRL